MIRQGKTAFTLIELLVVITIITVLLALLTPAIDKAIYQAQLAVCGTHLRTIATGAVVYAMDYKRSYPHRPGVRDDTPWAPAMIYNGSAAVTAFYMAVGGGVTTNAQVYDERPMLRTFLGLNAALNDPLTGRLNFDTTVEQTAIYATINLWFGWQFVGHRGMKRVGDRWSWSDANGDWRFNVLASDRDSIKGGTVQSTHPDHEGRTANAVDQDKLWTSSAWKSSIGRGPEDLNYAMEDGSVRFYKNVIQIDSEMAYIPEGNQGPIGWWVTMPPQK